MGKELVKFMPSIIYLLNTIECTGNIVPDSGMVSRGFLIIAIVTAALGGCVVGYLIGTGKSFNGLPSSLSVLLFNMDNYVLIGSLILLVFSIYFSIDNRDNVITVVILNIFSSIIFSWLLTKKTSIKDFKEKEEDLALRSYRHIDYIESAANTASQTIDNYISGHEESAVEIQLILQNAKEQIKYIQGGINTCKMDWFDLLSKEEKAKRTQSMEKASDYGTVQTVLSGVEINQEDA